MNDEMMSDDATGATDAPVHLPAADRARVRRAASAATSMRETTDALRRCLEFERAVFARDPRPCDPYALALCACWREELLRRRRRIDADAREITGRGLVVSQRVSGRPVHGRW